MALLQQKHFWKASGGGCILYEDKKGIHGHASENRKQKEQKAIGNVPKYRMVIHILDVLKHLPPFVAIVLALHPLNIRALNLRFTEMYSRPMIFLKKSILIKSGRIPVFNRSVFWFSNIYRPSN